MAEVPDHLVPRDGLTNSSVEFVGFDAVPGQSGARIRFDIFDEDQDYLTTFAIYVGPQPAGTIDALIVEGHRKMRDVLRQWLHGVDMMHKAYARPKPDVES